MRKLLLSLGILLVLSGGAVYATQDIPRKRNICHKTESESHPWEAIQINNSAYDTHIAHGDFDYLGPITEHGKPTKGGNDWCEGHVPIPPVEDTPTPPVVTPPLTHIDLPPEQPFTNIVGK